MAKALGVAGGSGSGKTTIALAVLASVGADRVAFLAQDDYYLGLDDPADAPAHNFDHPDAIDFFLLREHVRRLRAGEPVDVPVYDFKTHARTAAVRRVEPRAAILVEGTLIFADPGLCALLDLRLFVDTDADVRLLRRLRRDVAERGRDVEQVLQQYERHVRPMHVQFVEPSRREADVIVPEGGENHAGVELVIAHVERLLRQAVSKADGPRRAE